MAAAFHEPGGANRGGLDEPPEVLRAALDERGLFSTPTRLDVG